MGYVSCRADSSVATCNSYKDKKNQKKEIPPPVKIQQFNYSDLETATGGFSAESFLGRGSHGCVYKGVLREGKLVAIKKPSPGVRFLRDESTVENEIEILSKIQSPCLVNLVGFSGDSDERLLVVEFMSNGTLYDVLHCHCRPPTWGRRVRLALQTAKAVETLHYANPPIIHRDIKSSNVLIDGNWNARLGDFGLALRGHVEDIRLRSTPPAGTIGYLDPGYVTPDNLSAKNDVFSFGILLLEIISGRNAIDVNHTPPSIVDWALPLIRNGKLGSLYDPRIGPPKDPAARKQVAVIAAKCVRSCRESRPTMREVVEGLSILSKSIPLRSWKNLTGNPCLKVEIESKMVAIGRRNNPKREEEGIDDEEVVEKREKLHSASGSSVRGSLGNSKRVSDVGLCLGDPMMRGKAGSLRRHVSSGRNLMDLMAETNGDSSGSLVVFDWQGLATWTRSGCCGGSRRGTVGSSKTLAMVEQRHCYDGDGIFRLVRITPVGSFGGVRGSVGVAGLDS